jgi:membrane-bound acyltransferase YfiQ involved in biofilm formation
MIKNLFNPNKNNLINLKNIIFNAVLIVSSFVILNHVIFNPHIRLLVSKWSCILLAYVFRVLIFYASVSHLCDKLANAQS